MFQDNHLSYDILGRLVDSADDRAHLTFQYDKAGNRTLVTTHTRVAQPGDDDVETVKNSTRYYLYDAMNRQTVVDGVDAAGNISSTQGHQLAYDKNGNRTSDAFWGNKVTTSTSIYSEYDAWNDVVITYQGTPVYTKSTALVTESYAYDALARLQTVTRDAIVVDQRKYDAAGRVAQSGPSNLPTGYADALNEGLPAEQQIGMEVRRQTYDANGRMTFQRVYRSDASTLKYDIAYQGNDRLGNALGYDAAGNVLAYEFRNSYGGVYKNTTTTTLERYEGYVEKTRVTTTDRQGVGTGTVTSSYDANGYLVGVDDATENSLDKTIVNDGAGRVLRVRQNGNNLYTQLVNGQIVGQFGVGPNEVDPRTSSGAANFAQVADFGFGYRSITGSYPAASVGSYTVRQGDSLQGIAQAAFGDSGQWWRIAQANGLSGDKDLRVGQTLTLPAAVAGTSNNAGSFKPYNPAEVIGDTSPNLPQPSAQGGGCGAMGMVIMIVVAVAVTVFTAGALSTVAGATLAQIMTAGAATLTGAGTVAVGSVAGSLGLGFTGTAMAVGAVSAAVGSVASQLVGTAIGAQDSFSWKNVAMSAIGGGVTSGVAAGVGGAVGGSPIPNLVVRSAVSNAMTQGISVATGLQDQFNWAGVAASAVGATVGGGVNGAMTDVLNGSGLDAFTQKLVTGTAAGLAAGGTTALMRGGRVSVQQIATDAFGNALGQGLVDAASGPVYTAEEMAGDFRREENRFASATPASRGGASASWDVAPVNYSLAGGGRARFGTGSVEAQPSPDELQAAFRVSEREYRSATGESMAGAGYRARAGDSISRIVGSSDPQAIGNFMRANKLTSDRIEVGRNYFVPESTTANGDSTSLGQFVLNQGNERIAATSRNETQRELNRFAAMSEAPGTEPAWTFRHASIEQRKLDDARGVADYRGQPPAQFGSAPNLTSAPGEASDSLERTRLAIAAGIALPTILAPAVVYSAPALYELGTWGVASQVGMKAATELGITHVVRGMATGGAFSAGTYLGLEREEATPAGVMVAIGTGAFGGGVVKQGMNFAAGLSNTLVPLTWPNVATAATGFAFGFGTIGWLNAPPFMSEYGAATRSGQSWWTTTLSETPSGP